MKDRINKLYIKLEGIDNVLFDPPKSKKINCKRSKKKLNLLGKDIVRIDKETKKDIRELKEIIKERMKFINMVKR